MAFPGGPFGPLSIDDQTAPPLPESEAPLGAPDEFEDSIAPELRTPAFRAPVSDLEEEPLEMEERDILQLLDTYFDEAENARETGYEPRHEVWEQNLHAFWMRKTFSDKADWQSREVSAAVPNFVERFAATHWQALTRTRDWVDFSVLVKDPEGVMARFARKLTRIALDFAGTNNSGQPVPFEYIFGNLCQTGALMMMMAAVVWDARNGRTVVEPVDPRQCYFDPTKRGLYRVRFWEADRETLLRMAELVDSEGEPLYDVEAIEELVAHHDRKVVENLETSSGSGQMLTSSRTPILLKEWLVDLIDDRTGQRRKVREKQLIVTANDDRIIRGPEKNPWWHGKDWVVAHPVLQAPLMSPEGRTYVELFRPAADTHENVTNRILDLTSMVMNAFEVNPEYLDDPSELERGISPNKAFIRSEDAPPGEAAIRPIEMGRTVPADLMNVWQATRQEMQEAAAQSDVSLGQPVQSGATTATEATLSAQGQSVLNNSIAMGMDLGFLGPLAELVFYTTLQKVSDASHGIWSGLTASEQAMLNARREEMARQPFLVKAHGLTQVIERQRRQRALLGALNVIGGNPLLVQAFSTKFSMDKLLRLILEDFGVPIERIELTVLERQEAVDAAARTKMLQQAQGTSAVQDALTQQLPGGPAAAAAAAGGAAGGGGAPGIEDIGALLGAGGGAGQTAQNQNGLDPLANGVPEGIEGGIQ